MRNSVANKPSQQKCQHNSPSSHQTLASARPSTSYESSVLNRLPLVRTLGDSSLESERSFSSSEALNSLLGSSCFSLLGSDFALCSDSTLDRALSRSSLRSRCTGLGFSSRLDREPLRLRLRSTTRSLRLEDLLLLLERLRELCGLLLALCLLRLLLRLRLRLRLRRRLSLRMVD